MKDIVTYFYLIMIYINIFEFIMKKKSQCRKLHQCSENGKEITSFFKSSKTNFPPSILQQFKH